ncbi:prepilin-type N-terminal cleavage/methylation domain-containing protein [Acinetobacter sp.]|uniref:type IV pilin protein n=1 Tax=Acinetobacter sp. TaxID=472 RepID=UPI002590DDB5|nr:prepilin-type N-terminal cleavage/methylation domain-containing protein [Acinetobacter sp.]
MTRNGFTLIELMVVIVIVSVITAILVPNYQSYKRKNNEHIALQALGNIAMELEKNKERNFSFDGYSLSLDQRTIPAGKTGDEVKYKVFMDKTLQTWTVYACINDTLPDAAKYKNFAKLNDGRECEWSGSCILPAGCK